MTTSTLRACPVCKERRPRSFGELRVVSFVRCRACGSVYHAAGPGWQRIAQIYQAEYHNARGHTGDPHVELVKRLTVLRYLQELERLGSPGGRLLEVGCSTGVGLETAAAAGWEVEGVELSEASAALARERQGVRAVHAGRLEETSLDEGAYDVVVLFDVIEHIDPPSAALAHLRRLLRPKGLLLMVTPDAGSVSARLMGARWPHLLVEHVVLFSRRGMRTALQEAGFDIEQLRFAWKYVNLNMLVRHATIHPHVSFGWMLRCIGRATPVALLHKPILFNIGEFYVVARRLG